MNIRLQSLIFIVPIFVGIGLASAWLRLTAQEHEILWGLTEAAGSKAVSLAAWLDGDEASLWPDASKKAKLSLRRALETGGNRRAFVMSLDGSKVLYDEVLDGTGERPVVDAELFAKVREGGFGTSGVLRDRTGKEYLLSLAPIRGADGALVAALGVESPASELSVKRRELMVGAAWLIGGLFLLGIVVAVILSGLIRGRIRRLTKAAVKLATGDYDQRLDTVMIQEVSELNNTFNTLASVLGEVVRKTRRALVDAELNRSDQAIRRVYVEEAFAPIHLEEGNRQLVAMLANSSCEGDFFEIVPTPEGSYLIVGTVTASDPMQAVQDASAIRAFWRSALRTQGVPAAWKEARTLYALEKFECAFVAPGGETLKSWTLAVERGELVERVQNYPASSYLLHTLDPEAAARLEGHLRALPEVSVSELASELSSLLKRERCGALAVIGR